jgi:hypothetical protein
MFEPTVQVPDGIDPISAYRAWNFSTEGRPKLFPLSGGFGSWPNAWEGIGSGWVTACCGYSRGHKAPSEDCQCGFYSLKDLDSAIDLVTPIELSAPRPDGGRPVVLGRILLSGKVIEHEIGYRAERARVAELIPFRSTERSVTRLANKLGVGVAAAVEVPTSAADVEAGLRSPATPSPAKPGDVDDQLAYSDGGVLGRILLARRSLRAREVAEALRRRLMEGSAVEPIEDPQDEPTGEAGNEDPSFPDEPVRAPEPRPSR